MNATEHIYEYRLDIDISFYWYMNITEQVGYQSCTYTFCLIVHSGMPRLTSSLSIYQYRNSWVTNKSYTCTGWLIVLFWYSVCPVSLQGQLHYIFYNWWFFNWIIQFINKKFMYKLQHFWIYLFWRFVSKGYIDKL